MIFVKIIITYDGMISIHLNKPFSKILGPLDGSKNADKALDNALLIAEKFRFQIISRLRIYPHYKSKIIQY